MFIFRFPNSLFDYVKCLHVHLWVNFRDIYLLNSIFILSFSHLFHSAIYLKFVKSLFLLFIIVMFELFEQIFNSCFQFCVVSLTKLFLLGTMLILYLTYHFSPLGQSSNTDKKLGALGSLEGTSTCVPGI